MRRLLLALLGALLATAAPAAANPGLAGAVNGDLGGVRAATAKYHDVSKALADGYAADPVCVEVPGLGGMGHHYVNFALLANPALDPMRPEVLLYAPSGKGLKLVAVEWVYLYSTNPSAVPPAGTAKPAMFGHTFDGWMPGHFPGMPWHAELHAWVWQANPAGVFAGFNPNIRC